MLVKTGGKTAPLQLVCNSPINPLKKKKRKKEGEKTFGKMVLISGFKKGLISVCYGRMR